MPKQEKRMPLYLQNIVDDISFDSLPTKWQGFDFGRFSKDKTLFDFQKQALQNALKTLWLYFKDKKEDKTDLFNKYQNNGLAENFDYDLKKKRDGKTAKYLLEYDKDYPVEENLPAPRLRQAGGRDDLSAKASATADFSPT